ncbi:histone deacetylase complex subunit SAP130-A-like isoform X2 [Corticium candelabrum]|uniref:histone deacetylase complex subunit SAP130-A-like isoform X2 n=1 Tax=Corticium candelabrum TaxID=121492 RepID=UPI002E25D840|nr:histone deacetylase complex subunit SAP130-A-like isoform X2 [Corticium candelabrum]
MAETLNKPVKDDLPDDRGPAKMSQTVAKYEKEEGVAGDGLFYGARNAKVFVPKPMPMMPASPGLFANQTHSARLEPTYSNSAEMIKNSSLSSTLSSSLSPARVLRPNASSHIPMGPAAAAAISGVGPMRFPPGPLPLHSSSTNSKVSVLNSGSAFSSLGQQQHSLTSSNSLSFSLSNASYSRPSGGGGMLSVNPSLNAASSNSLHSATTTAVSAGVALSPAVPRISEMSSQPSFLSINSTGGAFQPTSSVIASSSELSGGSFIPSMAPFGANFNAGVTRVINSNVSGSAMSTGSVAVRQPKKSVVAQSVTNAIKSNSNMSSSGSSTSMAAVSHIPGLKSVTFSNASETPETMSKLSVDFRLQPVSSGSFSTHMSSAVVPSLSVISRDRQPDKSENSLVSNKYTVAGFDALSGQSTNVVNSTNVLFGYPMPFQSSCLTMSSESTSRPIASVSAAGNPMMIPSVSSDKPQGFSLPSHSFLGTNPGLAHTGSTGNLAVIGGGHHQPGLMTIGQQLQQQPSQLSVYGMGTRPSNTSSQASCISPSVSPRPAPTILRKRPNESMKRHEVQPPDGRIMQATGSFSAKTGSTNKHGLADGCVSDKKISTGGPRSSASSSISILTCTASSIFTSSLKQTFDDGNKADAISLLGHLHNSTAPPIKQVNAFNPFVGPNVSRTPDMVTVPMETASPRKKPRKQHFITTDDQYASNVPLEEGNNKYKEMVDEDDHWHKEPKARAMSGQSGVTKDSLDIDGICYRRSHMAGYRLKAPDNHFLKYSDARRREERTLALSEICSQRGINKQVSGWKLVRFGRQLDELADVEDEVKNITTTFQKELPSPADSRVTSTEESEVAFLAEIVQDDVERSKVVIEQMQDVKRAVKVLLDHSSHIGEILQKHTMRKPLPFSRRSKPEMMQHQ